MSRLEMQMETEFEDAWSASGADTAGGERWVGAARPALDGVGGTGAGGRADQG